MGIDMESQRVALVQQKWGELVHLTPNRIILIIRVLISPDFTGFPLISRTQDETHKGGANFSTDLNVLSTGSANF